MTHPFKSVRNREPDALVFLADIIRVAMRCIYRLCLHAMGSADRFDLVLKWRPQQPYPVCNNPGKGLIWPCFISIPAVGDDFQPSPIRNLHLVPFPLAFDPDFIPALHEPPIFPFLPDPSGKGHSTAVPTRTQRKTPKEGAVHMGRAKQFSYFCVKPEAKRHVAVGFHEEREVQAASTPKVCFKMQEDAISSGFACIAR